MNNLKQTCTKIPGGKLVCVQLALDKGLISYCKITGDFFLHPETAIEELEQAVIGLNQQTTVGEITIILQQAMQDITVVGMDASALAQIIADLLNE